MIDFVCAGGNKCGTTWLYEMVRQHPQLNVSTNKEPHYFTRNYQRGKGWYLKNWKSDRRPRGEFSTSYLYSDEAIQRMVEDCPDVRIVLLLRHPIDRSVSHLRHVMRSGVYASREQALNEHPEVVDNSRYADQVAKIEEAFGAKQVLVCFFSDIKDDPSNLVKRVFSFLNVDTSFAPDGLSKVVGEGFSPRYPVLDRLRKAIYEVLKRAGFYTFIQFIKSTGVTKAYKSMNASPDDEREVRDLFEEYRADYCTNVRRLTRLPSVGSSVHITEWISTLCN